MKRKIKIALAGNPNSGKTTIFNNLTGARQHVGNYPGVTVERKEGTCKYQDLEISIVDLPGTYSLTTYSTEEVIARNFILEEQPDVVVDIIDASNLERNLYLAVQLMELGAPLVLAFNMSDTAKARGYEFDLQKLERFFGASIVETIGYKNVGMQQLLDAVIAKSPQPTKVINDTIDYGREIEQELGKVVAMLENRTADTKYNKRWLALKLLERDGEVQKQFSTPELDAQVAASNAYIEKLLGESPETAIAASRYGFISGACQEAVRSTIELRHTISDKVDAIIINRFLGLPIFLTLMYLLFHLTFTLGEIPMEWLEELFAWIGGSITTLWPKGTESALKSLLVEGVIGGVGGVVVFLPNIILLFLAIAILEDSGYMARAAFIMDRLMHKIGLHGKSFIPMLIGFGCSVPAIMGTRTLENRRDRLTTMMVIPLMSCGARLPIYALIIPAFFPQAWQATMLWLIYCIGVALAILCAKLLRATILSGESVPFVMELPLYRMPTITSVLIHMWERSWLYLKKAGTIILGISIVLWAMTSYPQKTVFERDYQAQEQKLHQNFFAQLQQLNEKLGLPSSSTLLVQAMKTEMNTAAEQNRYYEHEAGFYRARENGAAAIAALCKKTNGKRIAAFIDTRDAIRRIRSQFAVSKDKKSPRALIMARERDNLLRNLRNNDAKAFAAAVHYLDKIDKPFTEQLALLEQARQAEQLAYSMSGRIGQALEPLLKPMGFDWKIGTALIGAFAAKEVFVAQMGVVYAVGEADEESETLRHKLRSAYSPLVAFCIMLFCLISAPCMATIAITKRESNSWKWALFQLFGLTLLAYIITTIVFQLGTLIGC